MQQRLVAHRVDWVTNEPGPADAGIERILDPRTQIFGFGRSDVVSSVAIAILRVPILSPQSTDAAAAD
jgi:hypothetical protein